jgi:hypothetical protein
MLTSSIDNVYVTYATIQLQKMMGIFDLTTSYLSVIRICY